MLVPIWGLVCVQVSKVRCLADLTTGGLISQQRLTSSRALLVWAIIENTPHPHHRVYVTRIAQACATNMAPVHLQDFKQLEDHLEKEYILLSKTVLSKTNALD